MNWEQKDGYITTGGNLRASIKYRPIFDNYQIRVGGLSAYGSAKTEEEAKEFAEEQLYLIKKDFILSLITQPREDEYSFGGLLSIIKFSSGWRVCSESDYLFQGTIEECKNYIVSCFLDK